MRRTYVHRIETEAPYAQIVSGQLEMANLEVLDGEEGEIEPGLRWILTPGHSDGLISLLVDTDDGLVVIALRLRRATARVLRADGAARDFGPSGSSCSSSGAGSASWTPRSLVPATTRP